MRRILQVQDQKLSYRASPHPEGKYDGMLDCLVRLVRRDGVGALYKGLTANYLKVVPSVSMAFVVFETIKAKLQEAFPSSKSK